MPTLKQLAATLVLASLGTAAAATGSLVIQPQAGAALVGEEVVLDVRGSAFIDAVVGGGFDLSFDAGLLQLNSVEINTEEWEFLSNPGTIDNTAGTLTAVWFNAFADPLPSGDFPVATLHFLALAPGLGHVGLSANADFPFVSDLVELIAVDYGSGSIAVSPVPELPAWAGLVLGLAGLPWLRRRMAQPA